MIHILVVPERVVSEQPHGEERWCFVCRKRRRFSIIVKTPIDIYSYYGPRAEILCDVCGQVDADCFPGTGREWGD